jgi:hypothetical protein
MRLRSTALPPVLLAALLAAPPAAAQSAPEELPPPPAAGDAERAPEVQKIVGASSIRFDGAGGGSVRQDGVALGLRAGNRSGRFGTHATFTWGLTDWDRAREWIDAGNSAGAWTTEKIKSVAQWSQEGGDAQPLRFMGAIFAEAFLAMTYVAVPACYVGSAAGATSHLQVDFTGSVHAPGGPLDLWAEGGVGAAAIPYQFFRWDYALGPVVGLGVDVGPVQIGGRFLWSPGGLNSSPRADDRLFTASLTLGVRN